MNESGDKKTETYQLDELSKKEDEANEDTPLKANDKDVEAGGGTDISVTKDNDKAVMASVDEKNDDKQSSSALLDQHKVKLILAILGAVLLVLLLLIVAILVIIYRDGWEEDHTYRYIRLIPKPNGPQNLLQFRHGHMPLEGRVWPDLVKQIDEFIQNYNPDVALRTRNVTDCVPGEQPKKGMVCFQDIRAIDEACVKGDYGYANGSPCIFIQFNNITGWKPEPFTPQDFIDYQNDTKMPNPQTLLQSKNMVYLECKGNSIIDQENMGPIEYTPYQGFPYNFFPYDEHPDYMPPFVAIRFKSPATSIAIGITCRIYAKNLNLNGSGSNVDSTEPVPFLPFNLFIE